MRLASSRRRSCGSFLESSKADNAALGIENDCAGDYRTEQRSTARFVESSDAKPATLPRLALVSSTAQPAHRAEF